MSNKAIEAASDRLIASRNNPNVSAVDRADDFALLSKHDLTNQQIAALANVTPQAVEQALILAAANEDTRELVASGKVAATTVITVLRNERQSSTPVIDILRKMVELAESEGKERATPKHYKQVIQATSGQVGDILTPLQHRLAKLLRSRKFAEMEKQFVSMNKRQVQALLRLIEKSRARDRREP